MNPSLTIPRSVLALSLLGMGLLACSADKAGPGGGATPADAQTATPATDTAAPAATTASPGRDPVPPAAPPATAAGIPPVEDSCAADAECGYTAVPVAGPHACCDNQCGLLAVTKAYVKKLNTACKTFTSARSAQHPGAAAAADCPPMMCDAALTPKPRCQAGRCVLR